MSCSQEEKHLLRAMWVVTLGTIRLRDPEAAALAAAALMRPSPQTIVPLLELGRTRPWASAVHDVLVQIGIAAAADILGGDVG